MKNRLKLSILLFSITMFFACKQNNGEDMNQTSGNDTVTAKPVDNTRVPFAKDSSDSEEDGINGSATGSGQPNTNGTN